MNLSEFKEQAKNIPANPQSRIPAYIKTLIDDEKNMINCHCHIFNEKTVPKTVFNMKMPYSKKAVVKIIKFLQTLNSRSNDDWASRLTRSETIKKKTLYGIDFYMVVVEGHYRSLKADFDSAMGDDLIYQIGNINPRKFLF